MKECDSSKIHIISNFILSICLLIMLDNLFLRPSLHCNTSLHFTTLHPTTLHYTYQHFTSSHLHFTTLSFGLIHLHFLPFYFTSHHQTRHSTVLHFQNYFQNNKPLHNLSPFHLNFFHLSYQPFTSLYFAIHFYNSLPFTFYYLSPSLPLNGFHFPNHRFENTRFTVRRPYRPFK